jgi:hypothetical protein
LAGGSAETRPIADEMIAVADRPRRASEDEVEKCLALDPVSLIRDRLPDFYFVQEVYKSMRCQNCDVKGRASIDFRRALGHDKLDERMRDRDQRGK